MTPSPLVAREVAISIGPQRPRIDSPIAEQLRAHGGFIVDGRVSGVLTPDGQIAATINISSNALTAPTQTTGGNAVVLTLDEEAARYFMNHMELEVAIRIKPRGERG